MDNISHPDPLIVHDITTVQRTLFAVLLFLDLCMLGVYLLAWFGQREPDDPLKTLSTDQREGWNITQKDIELGAARSQVWTGLIALLVNSILTLAQTVLYVDHLKQLGSVALTDSGAVLASVGTLACVVLLLASPLFLAVLLRACRPCFQHMGPEEATNRTNAIAVAITHLLLLVAMGSTLPGPLITSGIAANWVFLSTMGAAWSWFIVSAALTCCQTERLVVCQRDASFGTLVKRCYAVGKFKRALRGHRHGRANAKTSDKAGLGGNLEVQFARKGWRRPSRDSGERDVEESNKQCRRIDID